MKLSHITLAQLRALIAVDDTGSFTLASERLSRTQSAVSHSIMQLEQEFGTPLFERQREGAVPTAAGKLAIKEARIALVHLERLEHAVRGEAALMSGRLRLACFSSAVNWILGDALAEFSRRYPAIDLEILELADETSLSALRERKVDLGMVNLPCASIATFPLFEDELCIIISEEIAPDTDSETNLAQFANIPFIYPSGACSPLIEAAFQSAGIQPRIAARMTTHGAHLVLSLVHQKAGFSIMPAYALASEATSDLRVLPIRPAILRRVAFAMESEQSLSPAARAFLDLVDEIRRQSPKAMGM
ncbi:LysR family transcriptional regulator [Marinobacter salarius]|uniref:LysR family transcriptional regulator n=1 Tax=Marinobacter salarius TaxID=1420917 RepID=UPI0032F00F64